MTKQIVLPANVYDALELVAIAHGGVGRDTWTDSKGQPLCIYGCAHFADGTLVGDLGPVRDRLVKAGIHAGDNDTAVTAINRLRGRRPGARVPFAALCRQMGIVRGDS